jgi:hypothetical protein
LKVKKLSDEFGRFELQLKCSSCGHERHAYPKSLANLLGWDAPLGEIEKRMRSSKCNKRACKLRVLPQRLPRGARPKD